MYEGNCGCSRNRIMLIYILLLTLLQNNILHTLARRKVYKTMHIEENVGQETKDNPSSYKFI